MIIESRPLPIPVLKFFAFFIYCLLRFRFKKIEIKEARVRANVSYILMCNHFSFWDGLWALYLTIYAIDKQQPVKALYIMSVKKQMEKKWWLRYIGSFSIEPGKPLSVEESLNYISEKLNTPGNLLLYYPQGNLESSHIRHILFEQGIYEIITRIKGECQLIWCSTVIEYFESLKPSLYFDLLDCDTNKEFDFEQLKSKVNQFHLQALKSHVRFTREPGA
jgi:hypothetical protein